MSEPEQRFAGAHVFGTGRTNRGVMWLVPTHRKFAENYEFLLAYCVEKYEMRLISYNCLSNHEHWTLEDPHANIDLFKQTFRSLLIRSINAERGEYGNVFENRQGGDVVVDGLDTPLETAAYVTLQAVEAGLVRRHELWPGAHSTPLQALDGPRRVRRPRMRFYGPKTEFPEFMELQLHVPSEAAHDPEGWCRELERRVRAREGTKQAEMRAAGQTFKGARACQKVPYDSHPETGLNILDQSFRPRAKADTWEQREAIIEGRRLFIAEYRDARERWMAGDLDVIFPAGCSRLPRSWGPVRVASQPPKPWARSFMSWSAPPPSPVPAPAGTS